MGKATQEFWRQQHTFSIGTYPHLLAKREGHRRDPATCDHAETDIPEEGDLRCTSCGMVFDTPPEEEFEAPVAVTTRGAGSALWWLVPAGLVVLYVLYRMG